MRVKIKLWYESNLHLNRFGGVIEGGPLILKALPFLDFLIGPGGRFCFSHIL